MRCVFGLTTVLFATAFTRPLGAQTDSEFQSWGGYVFTGQLEPEAPSLRTWTDIHVRRGSGGTVLIFRPGLGYSFASWLTLWGGYAWIPSFNDTTGTQTNEHRIWEQATLQHSTSQWLLQSRTRLEQRFSDVQGDLGLRLREFVRVNFRPWEDVPFGIAIWDEVFVGLNDAAWTAQGFDQNRLFIGPAFFATNELRIEAGYTFVYLDREPVNQIQHVFGVNFFTALKPSVAEPQAVRW